MSTYGRNRESVVDMEEELYDFFRNHPEYRGENDSGAPLIPGKALVDVLRAYAERHDGLQLLSPEEEENLQSIAEKIPMDVDPQIILQFIAHATASSPRGSPDRENVCLDDRGRNEERDGNNSHSSRSSSRSRPACPPKTPLSARFPDSPFDSGRRQRTAPLQHAAPSSWNAKKPLPSYRRRSDAGNYGRPMSDTEQSTPGQRSRPSSRAGSRTGSNPPSPHGSHADLWGSTSSPPPGYVSSPPMRPHSRAQSHGQFSAAGYGYPSPEHSIHFDGYMSPDERSRRQDHQEGLSFDIDDGDDSFERALSRLPMPRSHSGGSHSDESGSDEDEDPTLGLVLDRSEASSMASLAPQDRVEALQRVNQDLSRKLQEAEKSLQARIADHETELERMENQLEETKSELNAKKREEKELRAKETRYIHQIAALESEVAKTQRALETAKASYQSLQKQYQEQCSESESLRNALRTRDEQFRDATDKISLHGFELEKWQQQHDQTEQQIAQLEAQLALARDAQAQLDEQKQENLFLKETIDRMRFDMDELRSKADGNLLTSGPAGPAGQAKDGSISKSLGQEILRMNNGKWMDESGGSEDEGSTAVDEEGESNDDTEGEDVVQTIITRRKKKVASRAMKRMETIRVEDVKEYSDAYTQYEKSEFTASRTTQTIPEPKIITASFCTQTEAAPVRAADVQTDPIPVSPPIVKVEIEIQTDVPESEGESSGSVTPDEELASSSSTVLPPTPKPPMQSFFGDLPPSYAQVAGGSEIGTDAQTQRDMRVAAETIRKWHQGLHLPLTPVPGGISEDALEEWTALKEEIGFDCLAIDRVIEMSLKTGQPRDVARGEGSSRDGAESTAAAPGVGARRFRKNRFYNIYNTFVYGHPEREAAPNAIGANLTLACVILGVCAIAASVISAPYAQPQYNVPGAPTYYDRAAWSQFNTMYPMGEGIAADGAATVWDFLGRIGGEAARMARGWPT